MRAVLDKAKLFTHCGYVPHPGQQAMHDSTARFRAVMCGCRWGKTMSAAYELVAAALAPNEHEFVGWWCAPLHQLGQVGFRNVLSILTQHFPTNLIRSSENEGIIVGRNFLGVEFRLYRRTTERGLVALTGSSVDMAVLDEASAIPDDVYLQAISTRLLDRKGTLLAISTPRGVVGWFPDMARAGLAGTDPDVWARQSPTWENPRLDKALLAREKAKLPERVWRQEYCAELVSADSSAFDAHAILACATGEMREPEAGCCYVGSIDWAGQGGDYTVAMLAKQREDGICEVVHVSRWSRMPFPLQVQKIRELSTRFFDPSWVCDKTGLGGPLVSQIAEAGVNARGITWSAATKLSMVRSLAASLERHRVIIPRPEVFPQMVRELTDYGFDGTSYNGPAGSTDDCCAALAMLCTMFPAGGSGGRIFDGRTGHTWSSPELDALDEHADRVPKTAEPPAVVTDDDPEIAELKRRAAAAAARRAAEQRDLVRRISGTPSGASGADGEPNAPFTQRPRRSQWGFDLDVRLGD